MKQHDKNKISCVCVRRSINNILKKNLITSYIIYVKECIYNRNIFTQKFLWAWLFRLKYKFTVAIHWINKI